MPESAQVRKLQDKLNDACWRGDLGTVQKILQGPEATSLANGDHGERWEGSAYGCTSGAPYRRPLARAAERGHLTLVHELLQAGAEVDAVNYLTETALHAAVNGGQEACIEALLQAGANPDLVASKGSVLAHAHCYLDRIAYLLDRGADPRPVDAFDRDAADIIALRSSEELHKRVAALRLYVERWPASDATLARHREQLAELEQQLQEELAADQQRSGILAALITPHALEASDWADTVKRNMPESMWEFDEELPDDDKPRAQVDRLRDEVLSRPEVIAHPQWGEVLRALIDLSPSYREVTEDAYGEPLDPDDADDDEGGVLDMFAFEEPSTIPDAFRLLAQPAAVARADWADLVRYTLQAHTDRYGTSPSLSSGDEEADEMFETDEVREHEAAGELWDLVEEVFNLESERP